MGQLTAKKFTCPSGDSECKVIDEEEKDVIEAQINHLTITKSSVSKLCKSDLIQAILRRENKILKR